MKPRPTVPWFVENGCELARPEPGLLVAIYAGSNGDPCRDCNCKATCPAWRMLKSVVVVAGPERSGPACPQCRSPLNMKKVERRGWKCACGQQIPQRYV